MLELLTYYTSFVERPGKFKSTVQNTLPVSLKVNIIYCKPWPWPLPQNISRTAGLTQFQTPPTCTDSLIACMPSLWYSYYQTLCVSTQMQWYFGNCHHQQWFFLKVTGLESYLHVFSDNSGSCSSSKKWLGSQLLNKCSGHILPFPSSPLI